MIERVDCFNVPKLVDVAATPSFEIFQIPGSNPKKMFACCSSNEIQIVDFETKIEVRRHSHSSSRFVCGMVREIPGMNLILSDFLSARCELDIVIIDIANDFSMEFQELTKKCHFGHFVCPLERGVICFIEEEKGHGDVESVFTLFFYDITKKKDRVINSIVIAKKPPYEKQHTEEYTIQYCDNPNSHLNGLIMIPSIIEKTCLIVDSKKVEILRKIDFGIKDDQDELHGFFIDEKSEFSFGLFRDSKSHHIVNKDFTTESLDLGVDETYTYRVQGFSCEYAYGKDFIIGYDPDVFEPDFSRKNSYEGAILEYNFGKWRVIEKFRTEDCDDPLCRVKNNGKDIYFLMGGGKDAKILHLRNNSVKDNFDRLDEKERIDYLQEMIDLEYIRIVDHDVLSLCCQKIFLRLK